MTTADANAYSAAWHAVVGARVPEETTMRVVLRYDAGGEDRFAFRLYELPELEATAARHALRLVVACTRFDEASPPSADEPRMQLVFER